MKKIFASAILAAVAAANQLSVASFTNSASPYALFNDATKGFAKVIYDIDLGYKLEGSLDHIDNGIVDTWAQVGLYSSADCTLQVNLLNIQEFYIKIATVPLYVVPFWTSIYWTHPGALMSGDASELSLAVESGYELHGGEIGLNYYINSLYPKVSLLDLILQTSTTFYPDLSIFTNTMAQNAGLSGWDWNIDRFYAWVEDPNAQFSLLDTLTENMDFNTSGPFFHLDLIGEVDTSSLYE